MALGFIILGLLSYMPMTGYDLKIFFDRSINFFWSAELSQIYRELSRLEKLGYIEYRIEQQEGRPNKKIYNLTEEGNRAFTEWLKGFPDTLSPVSRNEFLVRIFFSSRLDNKELISHFEDYIKEQEQELNTYKSIDENLNERLNSKDYKKEAFYQRLTVRRGISYTKAEIYWARECIEEIKGLSGSKTE